MNIKNKVQKGSFGYLEKQRKRGLIRTILFFAISLAVYLLGYLTTGSNQNYLTIAAVLGCLPASRSAVNTIMYYRYHGILASDRKKLKDYADNDHCLYDMVFTSYKENFEIHHITVKEDVITGYTANKKCDPQACEKHIRSIFAQNGKKVTVKIFTDISKYSNRQEQLLEEEVLTADEQESLALLKAISL